MYPCVSPAALSKTGSTCLFRMTPTDLILFADSHEGEKSLEQATWYLNSFLRFPSPSLVPKCIIFLNSTYGIQTNPGKVS